MKKARATQAAASQAAAYLKSTGPSLYNVIGGMRIDVEVQMSRGSPDYGTLIGSLIKQKVLPATAPLTLPNPADRAAEDSPGLVQPTARLEALTASIDQVVAFANQRPSASDLQACHVDPAAAGINMKVEPAMVSIKPGEHTVALVSGGTPPYTITLMADAASSDQLAFTVASNGILTVEAKSGAKPGTYTTYVLDGAKGRETLLVTVSATPAPSNQHVNNAPAPQPAAACAKSDPAVTELQNGLRKLGITQAKVDPADADESVLVVDGCPGKVTYAAVRKFYTDQQHMSADAVKKMSEAELLKAGMDDVKAAAAKQAAQAATPAAPAVSAPPAKK